jgi:hypothetical protein
VLNDWGQLGVEELAGELGVSHHLAPAPVVNMLLGEWRSLLEAGRRLEEVREGGGRGEGASGKDHNGKVLIKGLRISRRNNSVFINKTICVLNIPPITTKKKHT